MKTLWIPARFLTRTRPSTRLLLWLSLRVHVLRYARDLDAYRFTWPWRELERLAYERGLAAGRLQARMESLLVFVPATRPAKPDRGIRHGGLGFNPGDDTCFPPRDVAEHGYYSNVQGQETFVLARARRRSWWRRLLANVQRDRTVEHLVALAGLFMGSALC